MNSSNRREWPRFSLRSLLLVCCGIAILIGYRQAFVNCYHRLQIHALTNGYYNAPGLQLVAAVEYHYSVLADAGGIVRVSRAFSGPIRPELSQIMRLPNLPPHHLVSVVGGTKTTVNVYADKADEQDWEAILKSIGP